MSRRILLLVPHPDDEVVGCAAAIGRARTGAARLFALYLTTGIPARTVEWRWRRDGHAARVRRRRHEALAAAERLGLDPVDFMPWPSRELRMHLEAARAAIAHHARRLEADVIWTPAYEGGHQDHDVTNFLASTFRAEAQVWEFSEYNAAGGVRSHQFPTATGAEIVIQLSAAESTAKAATLALYRSESSNLSYVRFVREAFRPLADCDYSRAPHPGVLFYQRFQWVPFRHPRVDFTSPAEVSAALGQLSTRRHGTRA